MKMRAVTQDQQARFPSCAPGRQGPCFTTGEISCLWHALSVMSGNEGGVTLPPDVPPTWEDVRALLARVMSDCDVRDGRWLHNEELYGLMQKQCPELARIIRYFALRPPRYMNPESTTEMSILDIQMVADQFLQHYSHDVDFDTMASAELELDEEIGRFAKCDPDKAWARIMLVNQEHWVALFSPPTSPPHLGIREMEYFDSYGEAPEEMVCNRLSTFAPSTKIRWNTLRHQYDTYMCGVYCLFFVFNRLNGVPLTTFCRLPIDLKMIQDFRAQIQQPECP